VLAGLGLLLVACLRPRRPRWRAAVAAATVMTVVLGGCGLFASSSESYLWKTGRVLYYHQAIGAGPTLITRGDGTVFEERRYEPFGEELDAYRELAGGGSETGPIDFVADHHNVFNKTTDPATGWSYHGARWMAPETARWLTPDPPVKAPQPKFMMEPWGLHPYQYVEQNPELFWDPDGKKGERILVLYGDFGAEKRVPESTLNAFLVTYYQQQNPGDTVVKAQRFRSAADVDKAIADGKGTYDRVIFLSHGDIEGPRMLPNYNANENHSPGVSADELIPIFRKHPEIFEVDFGSCNSGDKGLARDVAKGVPFLRTFGYASRIKWRAETENGVVKTSSIRIVLKKRVEFRFTENEVKEPQPHQVNGRVFGPPHE